MSTPVLCAGIVVADLFVPPLPVLPAAGELLVTDDFLLSPGGCAANTAISLGRLGVAATVAGKVGEDVFGDFLEQDLRRRGIDTGGLRRSARCGTSKTVVLTVPGEDRRYVHTFGANADFHAGDLEGALVDGVEVLYLGGYLLLPALEQKAVAELFALARAGGARTVLDVVVPAGDETASLDRLRDLLPHVDVFMPNGDEAAALTGEREPERQARRFLEAGAGTALITLGADGVVAASGEESLAAPAPQVDAVDESGAGDAFAAGFIVGLLEGWKLERSVRFASAIGASACTRLGCTDGVFTRAEAEAFLAAA